MSNATIKKTITKELIFLNIKTLDRHSIDDIIEFLQSQPKKVGSKYLGGRDYLLDNVKLNFNVDCEIVSIDIGFNNSGSVRYENIKAGLFYYFRADSLESVKDPETIQFW